MSRLGWGKKKITEGCINDWYKDQPIGCMVQDMRDNHRLLAEERGGGRYKDSILVYDWVKFMKSLNLPLPDIQDPAERYIELAEAVKIYQSIMGGEARGYCTKCREMTRHDFIPAGRVPNFRFFKCLECNA